MLDKGSEVSHKDGSSYGHSRIVRSGDEHPNYPKWTAESYKKMKELEVNKGDVLTDYPSYNIVESSSEAHKKILQTKDAKFAIKVGELVKDSLLAPQKVVEELKDFAPDRYLSKNVALALRDSNFKMIE